MEDKLYTNIDFKSIKDYRFMGDNLNDDKLQELSEVIYHYLEKHYDSEFGKEYIVKFNDYLLNIVVYRDFLSIVVEKN